MNPLLLLGLFLQTSCISHTTATTNIVIKDMKEKDYKETIDGSESISKPFLSRLKHTSSSITSNGVTIQVQSTPLCAKKIEKKDYFVSAFEGYALDQPNIVPDALIAAEGMFVLLGGLLPTAVSLFEPFEGLPQGYKNFLTNYTIGTTAAALTATSIRYLLANKTIKRNALELVECGESIDASNFSSDITMSLLSMNKSCLSNPESSSAYKELYKLKLEGCSQGKKSKEKSCKELIKKHLVDKLKVEVCTQTYEEELDINKDIISKAINIDAVLLGDLLLENNFIQSEPEIVLNISSQNKEKNTVEGFEYPTPISFFNFVDNTFKESQERGIYSADLEKKESKRAKVIDQLVEDSRKKETLTAMGKESIRLKPTPEVYNRWICASLKKRSETGFTTFANGANRFNAIRLLSMIKGSCLSVEKELTENVCSSVEEDQNKIKQRLARTVSFFTTYQDSEIIEIINLCGANPKWIDFASTRLKAKLDLLDGKRVYINNVSENKDPKQHVHAFGSALGDAWVKESAKIVVSYYQKNGFDNIDNISTAQSFIDKNANYFTKKDKKALTKKNKAIVNKVVNERISEQDYGAGRDIVTAFEEYFGASWSEAYQNKITKKEDAYYRAEEARIKRETQKSYNSCIKNLSGVFLCPDSPEYLCGNRCGHNNICQCCRYTSSQKKRMCGR